MNSIILLDSTPVGLITNPKATPLAIECQQWLNSLLDRQYHVVLPEIIDYSNQQYKTLATICRRKKLARNPVAKSK